MRYSPSCFVIPFSLALFVGIGCDRNETSSTETPAEGVHLSAPNESAAAPEGPRMPHSPPIKGEVTETMDVTRYTYLHVKTVSAAHWVAVPRTKVETGDRVEITGYNIMRDFHSKSLSKTFPEIYFASRVTVVGSDDRPTGTAPDGTGATPPGHPPIGTGPGTKMPPGHPPVMPQ